MEITSTTNQAGTQTAASQAQNKLGVNIDSFLLLLTAQIKNQDPLKPMDSTTFVSQLAQLSQVEQAVTTNDNLQNISGQFTSLSELSGVQLIGREVTLASDKLDLNSGQATMQYELTNDAEQVHIVIKGLNGEVLKDITDLPKTANIRQTVNWDGISAAGLQVADGAYTFEVVAGDVNQNPVPYSSFVVTTVDKLTFSNGQPMLQLHNDQEVPSSAILDVK